VRIKYIFVPGLLLCLMLFWTAACGGGGSELAEDANETAATGEDVLGSDPEPETGKSKTNSAEKKLSSAIIKSVSFLPAVLRSNSNIEIKVETFTPKEGADYFVYVFCRNGEVFKEKRDNNLEAGDYKKGDLFYTEVKLYDGANNLLEEQRTDLTEIQNSAPTIKSINIPNFRGFGLYEIKVMAEDSDGDQLAYSLEGENRPASLSIDPTSGIITYQFSDPPPEELKFIVVVKDSDGAMVKKQVTIPFVKKN